MLATCLYRSSRIDVYHAIFQRDGKQVKRSLKTTDPELAKRRREIHRQKVERLNSDSAKNLPFAEYDKEKPAELIGGLAKRWIEIAGGTMEASSRDRMLGVIRNLNQHFSGLTVRNVTLRTLEQGMGNVFRALQRIDESYPDTAHIKFPRALLAKVLQDVCRGRGGE